MGVALEWLLLGRCVLPFFVDASGKVDDGRVEDADDKVDDVGRHHDADECVGIIDAIEGQQREDYGVDELRYHGAAVVAYPEP